MPVASELRYTIVLQSKKCAEMFQAKLAASQLIGPSNAGPAANVVAFSKPFSQNVNFVRFILPPDRFNSHYFNQDYTDIVDEK